jgi:energy-coupling factor transporter ATP-binding protein EcfA2
MHIRQIHIQNLRSIRELRVTFDQNEYAGWHVFIGDNGSGKSTLIRAASLCLTGPIEAPALRQDWNTWLPPNDHSGFVSLYVHQDTRVDIATGRGKQVKNFYIDPRISLIRDLHEPTKVSLHATSKRGQNSPYRYLWGSGRGWFSAAYGPFRRFAGGDKGYEKLYYSNPRLARHLSAFGEDVALSECLEWLQHLHIKSLEQHPEGDLLGLVTAFVNSGGLLPHNTVLDSVSSDGVAFRDGNGCVVPVTQLSDGYRSVLSMTFELLRQLILDYGADPVFAPIRSGNCVIDLPGVVLVDEIDAHLHPSWQRRIGQWFTKFFPNLQFIVTTHSPLVCRAAERGTVWRLARPGEDEPTRRVTGSELQQLFFGNILEAYETELFGENISRSDASREKLSRIAQLNQKAVHGSLSDAEQVELKELRSALPTNAASLTIAGSADP